MNKVIVLVEGYAHPRKNGDYVASPTTTLIEDSKGKMLLVDPGTNAKALLDAFKKHQLKFSDIDCIYLTHNHPDHFLNIKLFPKADLYDNEIIWRGDKEIFHQGKLPINGVEILKTPGHSSEHSSLLVETEKGKVCVAADVFWWEDGKQKSETVKDLVSLTDPFATDKEALIKSRKLLLAKADWIIPGHGKMFKNPTI